MTSGPIRAATTPRERERSVLHARRQLRFGRFEEEVVVRGHQDHRVQSPAVRLDGSPQPVHPLLTVRVIADDRLSLAAA